MKRLVFILGLVVILGISAAAQLPCPSVVVQGPSSLTPIGESMTFTAKAEGIELDKVKFEWTVDKGTIVIGQNTSSITVATNADIAGQTVTAAVKIGGLAQDCKNVAYEFGEVEAKVRLIFDPKLDEYVKISWRDEKVRLDNLAIQLKENDKTTAFFLVHTKEKNYFQKLKARETKIKQYLFEKYKIEKSRIRLIYSGKGEYLTTIWIVPNEAFPPVTQKEKPLQKVQ